MNSTDVTRLLGSTAEEQLVRFASTFDALWEGVQLLGPDWRYLYVNQAVCRHGGKTREALLGRTVLEVYPELAHSELVTRLAEALATGQPRTVLTPFTPAGGGESWFEVRINPHEHGLVLFSRDVTAQHRLELEREREQKFEALGHLAGGVAHDFNNLLTVIASSTQSVLGDLPAGSPLADELRESLEATERAAALAQQLLAFSKSRVAPLQVVALDEVTRTSQWLLARLVPPPARLVVDVGPQPVPVRANQVLLEQVLMNLVLNARHAIADTGEVRVEVGIQMTPRGPRAVLRVADTGRGMDAATCARVFDPFFTTREREGGTGLGLTTVAAIASRLAGSIDVQSELGRGTTFTLSLPLAEVG